MSSIASPMTKRPIYFAILIFVTMALNYLDRSILAVLIVPMKPELHLSDTDIGWLLGFGFALVYAMLGVPLARLADRVGRPLVVGIGLIVWSAATIACGYAASFISLLVARIFVGVGEAAGTAPALALLGDQYPKDRRPFILGVVNAGGSLGTSVGLALGGAIAQSHGWRTAFLAAGIPGIALGILLLVTMRESRAGSRPDSQIDAMPTIRASVRFVLGQRAILFTMLGSLFLGVILLGLLAWSSSYFARVHRLPLPQIGATLGVIKGVAGVLGALLGGWLSTRLTRRDDRWQSLTPAMAMFLLSPVFAVFLLADDVIVAFGALGVAVFLMSATLGPILAIYQNTSPTMLQSQVVATHVLIASIGFGCGPLLIGHLNETFFAARGPLALQSSMWVLAIASLLAGGCFSLATTFIRGDIARADRPILDRTSRAPPEGAAVSTR